MPGPRGMQPTARADEIRQPLRAALTALEQAVAPQAPFEPATAAETWRVAATDYMASAIFLPMLSGLRRASPGSRLAVFELQPARLEQQAASDKVDLFFHTREGHLWAASAPAVSRALCAGGQGGHPALRHGLSLKTFCQLEQVVVSPDGGGFSAATDSALATLGLTRRVVLSVPHFLFMLETLRNSDLVAVLPERLVRGQSGLVVVEPPLAVAGFEMLMLWHERWHRDPAHQWLRQFIVNSLEEQAC